MPSVLLQILISPANFPIFTVLWIDQVPAGRCIMSYRSSEGHGIVPHNCSEDCPLKL